MSIQAQVKVNGRMEKVLIYTTWYEFRQELGKKLGFIPLNWLWLKIKPKDPLPWTEANLSASLNVATRLVDHKITPDS